MVSNAANAPSDLLDVDSLRSALYNATLIDVRLVHEELGVFRIRPDKPLSPFAAGQYVALGLGGWEPRIAGAPADNLPPARRAKLIRRAYSICSPMLDEAGRLTRAGDNGRLEFYIALVRRANPPAALTPRLFALAPGDRLHLESHVVGRYTLSGVCPSDDVAFFGTGTGEAPHNAMIGELLSSGHKGRIVAVTCVRRRRDLAYESTHRELERRFPNYRYLTLTTREPENLDPSAPGFVGKLHLQDYAASPQFAVDCGWRLDPRRTHAFLCGNPDMIGYRPAAKSEGESMDGPSSVACSSAPAAPSANANSREAMPLAEGGRTSRPGGMIQTLERLGFHTGGPDRPGKIRFEKYW